jgi:hypothetical protein
MGRDKLQMFLGYLAIVVLVGLGFFGIIAIGIIWGLGVLEHGR